MIVEIDDLESLCALLIWLGGLRATARRPRGYRGNAGPSPTEELATSS